MATKSKKPGSSLVASNKRAYHDYHVLESIKCGVVLTGTEIKSIRGGKTSMNQAFARIENGELWLYGVHIPPYEQGSYNNHDPDRRRKLLVTKQEIKRLLGRTKEQGLTLVPLKMFFERAWVKVDLGLCKGKKLHDKRATIAERDHRRDIERAMKSR